MAHERVGVLTFHRCINHGSYWQARCLVDGLRARGHDAVIIDHRSRRVDVAEWRCALRPTLPTPVPRADVPLYRTKLRTFAAAVSALPLTALDHGRQQFDVVVVGSDEVWNLSHPWYGGAPMFFGDGVRADRLVSYAASFGNYDASWGLDGAYAARLRDFDAISVRDENSRELVSASTGRDPTVVLDPCLQFPPSGVELGEWRGPTAPFAVVYGHNFSPAFAAGVRAWADARGVPLVSVSYRNDWADEQWIDAGPFDFAAAMSRATAVATNFFHGCVFALHEERPFVCETSPYRYQKVRCLMAEVGGERHLVGDDTPHETYRALLDAPPEPAVLDAIGRLRVRSDAYLSEALG